METVEAIIHDDNFWILLMWLGGSVGIWAIYMGCVYQIAKNRSRKARLLFKELYALYTYGYLQHKAQKVHDLIQYAKYFTQEDWLPSLGMYIKMTCGYCCCVLGYGVFYLPKLRAYLDNTYIMWTLSSDGVAIWMQEAEDIIKPHRHQLYEITSKEELLRG